MTTLAGGTEQGFADGYGATAKFRSFGQVAADSLGNIFYADTYNNRIRKITAEGFVSTYAGTGVYGYAEGNVTSAQFRWPGGIAISSDGTVFVADSDNQRIRKISPAGIVSTLAGSGQRGLADGAGAQALFDSPNSMTVDPQGNILVVDRSNLKIRKVTPEGVVTTVVSGSIGDVNFPPVGISVTPNGDVYVSNVLFIWKVTPDGSTSIAAGNPSPTGYHSDGPGASAEFFVIRDIASDDLGNVYVADYTYLRKLDASGIVTTVAGSDPGPNGQNTALIADGPITTARMSDMQSIDFDLRGNLYMSTSTGGGTNKVAIKKITGLATPVQETTTTSLVSQAEPWSVGVAGTFTAATTSSATAPVSGTVELREGTTVLSSKPVGPNGVTTFSLTLPVGPHLLTATFLGAPNNSPSTSSPVTVEPLPAPALDISIGRVSTDVPAIIHVRLSTKSAGSFFKFSLPDGQVPPLPAGDSAVRPVIGGEASWEFDVPSPPSSLRFRVEAVSDAQGTTSAALFSERTVSINPCSGWSYELVDGAATSVCGGALFSYVQDAPAILLDNTLQVPAGLAQLVGRTEFVEIQEPDYYGPAFQIRIKGTTKCWSVPGANPEEMIASVSTNLDPASGTGILVVPCNKTNPAQWFYLEYGSKAVEGNWVYELRPYWNEVGFAVANGALLGTGVETPLCVSITEFRPPSTGSPRVVLRKCEPYGQNPRQYWKAGPGKQTRFDGLDDRPERPYPATGLLKAFSRSVNKSQDCSATLTRLKNDPPSKAFVTTAAHCVFGEFGSVPKDIRVSFALMGRRFCAQYSDIRAKGDSKNGGQAADKDFAFIKVSTECNGALGALAGTGVEAWQLADPVVYAVSYRGALSTASFPDDVRETFGQVEARRVSVPVFSIDEYRVDGHLSHGSSGGMIGNRGVISGVVTAIDPPGDFPQPTTMNVSQRSFRGARFRLNSTTLMASAAANLRNSVK